MAELERWLGTVWRGIFWKTSPTSLLSDILSLHSFLFFLSSYLTFFPSSLRYYPTFVRSLILTVCLSNGVLHSSSIQFTFLIMRLTLRSPPTLLSLLAIVLSSTHTTTATPFRREESIIETRDSLLEPRDCAIPCGWDGLLCCQAGQSCFTDQYNKAQCGVGVSAGGTTQQYNNAAGGVTPQNNIADGSWQYYTSMFVETDLVTRTSVYSSFVGAANYVPTPTVQVLVPEITNSPCSAQLNEIPCGGICCAVGQYCAYQGQCAAISGVEADPSSYYFSSVMNAQTGSAFIRPTSVGFFTITSTGAPTTTVAFQAPMSTGAAMGVAATSGGGGLSGGAIAGIVIGVLLGLFLLFLFCAFFCFKGLWDGVSRLLFGTRRKERRSDTCYVERHSTHGGPGRRTWFGGRPAAGRPARKSDAGIGGFLGVAGALAALAAFLGLKRRGRDKSSYGTGSSYTYSDYTSTSKYIAVVRSVTSTF